MKSRSTQEAKKFQGAVRKAQQEGSDAEFAWFCYFSNPIAGRDDSLSHRLGRVPSGFVVERVTPTRALVTRGTRRWTTRRAYLQCSVPGAWVEVLIS